MTHSVVPRMHFLFANVCINVVQTSRKDTYEILCNENDENEMKALVGFKPPAHNGKRHNILLAPSLPTELPMLTTISFQNSQTLLLTMLPKCFDFNVSKQEI